ncbi:MAG: hypothetical protein LBR06_07630 [Bacteroidales bacterium]|jgi:hypothetical protein|nr:hypothetical protein [Bacteroidales bacterium]
MKRVFSYIIISIAGLFTVALQAQPEETVETLARQFVAPSDIYRPHTWWHWLGTFYSKEGITADLEAMKEAGIGGVVVFNAPAWLDTLRAPWPQQTYRSTAYWDALGHALKEARRLNMQVGIHNTPGWSTTGGTWISPEEDGMKAATFSTTKIAGGQKITVNLPTPAGDYYKDVAVMAVPAKKELALADVCDISDSFSGGVLTWDAPQGEWTVYRFGWFSTMQRSHPAPEDVAATAFEADKMNIPATIKHWTNVLTPLRERFGDYIGTTFNDIWIDSYEAWGQSWTPEFRTEFIRMKGYDPVPQIVLAYERGDAILNNSTKGIERIKAEFSDESKAFLADYKAVVNRLFLRCWETGLRMCHEAGFRLCFEPYGSIISAPFDIAEGVGIADIPVTEFWVHSHEPSGGDAIAQAAARFQKRIVGAEAFTGMEATCQFTETPAMLKRPADMGYNFGVNRYYLHSWAHNPFGDQYRPGFVFAHYGTHFSRLQTWLEPGKAFFTYLTRCQMLLQQGSFIERNNEVVHRRTPQAEIFFVRNTGAAQEKTFEFPVANRVPELWNAYTGTITAVSGTKADNGNTLVTIHLEKDESVFVIFPAHNGAWPKLPERRLVGEAATEVSGSWTVTFNPATGEKPFRRKFQTLVDFSEQNDAAVKYFSGTAVYEKSIHIKAFNDADTRIVIALGRVGDIAEVEINGRKAGVLWTAPFSADITPLLKPGANRFVVRVTNTWVNRLIGDEQYPRDFEWEIRESNRLPVMKGLPEWFLKGTPRPEPRRKTFAPWFYHNKDSKPEPAGLIGPVSIVCQTVTAVN